jgi:hypothetical protein
MIHIAGFPVRVGNHKRQLCAWCGFRLVDIDLANCASSDGAEPGHWEPNALVRVIDGNPTAFIVVKHVDGEAIPAGWCGDEGKARLRAVPPPKGTDYAVADEDASPFAVDADQDEFNRVAPGGEGNANG